VKVFSHDIEDRHFREIESILKNIDRTMNRQLKGSEINQVNQQAGIQAVSVSAETFKVVQRAIWYAELSGGRFDPTVGPLVDLWGIGSKDGKLPDEAILAHALKLVNYKDIVLDEDEQSIKLARADMSLDLGAIAKGYAADQVAEYLKSQRFDSAIIDLGGNILAMGTKPNSELWLIGIQNPESIRGKNIGTLQVNNKTVVSSGTYERFFVQDGVHYHHILDPMTGQPIRNHLLSVTIITGNSIDADALSTAAFSMGLKKGLAFAESLEDVEGFFITDDHRIYTTSGLTDQLNIHDASYTQNKQ